MDRVREALHFEGARHLLGYIIDVSLHFVG
jgi:hypothetical protein